MRAGWSTRLLELAARADQEGFGVREPFAESPANAVRSVARFFVSDVEDKPWYNDREFWRALPHHAGRRNRFNRFNLTLGIGYDFARQIRDCYFHFPVSVPARREGLPRARQGPARRRARPQLSRC